MVRPAEVQILVDSSTEFRTGGIQAYLIFDESVVRVENREEGMLRLMGVAPGRTLLIIWTVAGREMYAVRVLPPSPRSEASLRTRPLPPLASGWMEFGYSQTSNNREGLDQVLLHQSFFLQEQVGENELLLRTELFQTPYRSRDLFNLSTATVSLRRHGVNLELIDFGLVLDADAAVPFVTPFALRGIHVLLLLGDKRLELFSGITTPSHFLRLKRTRSLSGSSFYWNPGRGWELGWTLAFVEVPLELPAGVFRRAKSGFALFDLERQLTPRLTVTMALGASKQGSLVRGALRYLTPRTGLTVEAKSSSPHFSLNQMNLLLLGSDSFSLHARRSLHPTWSLGGSLQVSQSELQFPFLQSRRSLSSNLSTRWQFHSHHSVDAQVSFARDRSAPLLAQPKNGSQRTGVDLALSSRSDSGWLNVFRYSFGRTQRVGLADRGNHDWSVEDRYVRYFGRSRSNWMVSGSWAEGTVGQSLFPAVPSPVEAPRKLQDFIRSKGGVWAVGSAVQLVGSRFNLGPSFNFQRTTSLESRADHTLGLGLVSNFWLGANLSLTVNLSEGIATGGPGRGSRRSNGFAISLQHYFDNKKAILLWGYTPKGRVSGVVYEDVNLSGFRDPGEKGLAGVNIQLSTGTSTSTDESGQYQFRDVPLGQHEVRVDLGQFVGGVHFTTPTRVPLLFQRGEHLVANFGVNNLSHLLLLVFNDYRLDGKRYPDAPGVAGVEVELAGAGMTRGAKSDSGGRIEIRDLPSGRYLLRVQKQNLPTDFVVRQIEQWIELGPAQVKTLAVAVQALRAARGKVFYDVNRNGIQESGEPGLEGLRVAANGQGTETGQQGEFLLSDLPASKIEITLEPGVPLPEELRPLLIPISIQLGKDPEVKNGLAFAISDLRLIEFLRRR